MTATVSRCVHKITAAAATKLMLASIPGPAPAKQIRCPARAAELGLIALLSVVILGFPHFLYKTTAATKSTNNKAKNSANKKFDSLAGAVEITAASLKVVWVTAETEDVVFSTAAGTFSATTVTATSSAALAKAVDAETKATTQPRAGDSIQANAVTAVTAKILKEVGAGAPPFREETEVWISRSCKPVSSQAGVAAGLDTAFSS